MAMAAATSCIASPQSVSVRATTKALSRPARAFESLQRQGVQHRRQAASVVRVQAVLTAEVSFDVAKMAPLGDRLLIKPREEQATTAGGIILPGTAKGGPGGMAEAYIGSVMAVGEDVDIGVAVGDTVLFSKYSSSEIEVPDGQVCFVAQKSIMAKLS